MKKIKFGAILLLLVLCLCSCEDPSIVDGSDYAQHEEQFIVQYGDHESVITQYNGKGNYEEVSFGSANLVVDEKYYYYVDLEKGLCRIDKASGEKKIMLEGWDLQMFRYDKFIYFDDGNIAEVAVFNTETQELKTTSYKNIASPFDLEAARTSAVMVKDGWIVRVQDRQVGEVLATYLCDRDFKTKNEIFLSEYVNFTLGDELFFLYNGQPMCYNTANGNAYYLWDLNLNENAENPVYTVNPFQYLGNGKILAVKDKKLKIFSLSDMQVEYEFSNISMGELDSPSAVYDDEYMYFMHWENEESFRIEKISHKDNKSQKIYEETLELPLTYCELCAVDEDYLYLFYSGYYNDDDTPSDCYYRMKKDGTGLERII